MKQKNHLMDEYKRHGERIHQEIAMHERHGIYKHEEEYPKQPSQGHMIPGFGAEEFKGQADPIAYGQAAKQGMASDMKKIHGQFKNYGWD